MKDIAASVKILAVGFLTGLMISCSGSKPAVSAAVVEPARNAFHLEAGFWNQWGDGLAEVSSYELTYPRYGKLRNGVAVTVFVSESFSYESRVKADAGNHAPADVFPVMKLNVIEDFQTGIYDYNEQTSAFLALDAVGKQAAGVLTKVSFSSQEWCGHSWMQWLRTPAGLAFSGHSYFDGEADRAMTLSAPEAGVAEEQLPFWARGMAEPKLYPGEFRTVRLLPSLQNQRHSHRNPEWTDAKLTRDAKVVDGVETWRVEIPGGATTTYSVEQAAPRKILQWQSSTGESAKLIKSVRLKYWELNRPGGESELQKLGLSKRPAKTT